VSLLGADGKATATTKDETGPWSVNYAFILGTRDDGSVQVVDHEYVLDVRSRRIATLDDMYSAAGLAWNREAFPTEPQEDKYATAFLIFQLPEGPIIANPDVFHNVIPMLCPMSLHVKGACDVIRGQIVAQKASEMAAGLVAPLAVAATLATLKKQAESQEFGKVQKLVDATRNR
jgi:hypothetical protein